MKKKLLSLVLAATMLVGATMTVFATESAGVTTVESVTSGQVSYDSDKAVVPIINVTVSRVAQAKAITINPYNLTVGTTVTSNDSVIIGDISFNNNGNTPISLNLKGYVKVSSNDTINVVTTAPTKQSEDHQVYVAVKYVNSSGKEMLQKGKTTKVGYVYYPAEEDLLKTSPVLAVSNNGTPTVEGTSYQVVLKFTGVAMPSNVKDWKKTDQFNVITIYDIRTEKNGTGVESKFDTNTSPS